MNSVNGVQLPIAGAGLTVVCVEIRNGVARLWLCYYVPDGYLVYVVDVVSAYVSGYDPSVAFP